MKQLCKDIDFSMYLQNKYKLFVVKKLKFELFLPHATQKLESNILKIHKHCIDMQMNFSENRSLREFSFLFAGISHSFLQEDYEQSV